MSQSMMRFGVIFSTVSEAMNDAPPPSPVSVTSSAAILGAVIARLRKKENLTQQELGERVGVGATTWSRIEQGSSQLSMDQLRAAANALGGLSASEILARAEEVEKTLKTAGIVIEDIPPQEWAGMSSNIRAGNFIGATFDPESSTWAKPLSTLLKAGSSKLMALLVPGAMLIPLTGAALASLVARYMPEDSEKKKK